MWSASVSKTGKNENEHKKKKKCCLAKGVDVIKTTATNCSFVLCRGVNFGHVFSGLIDTHRHKYVSRIGVHNGGIHGGDPPKKGSREGHRASVCMGVCVCVR